MNLKLRFQNWGFWTLLVVGVFSTACGLLNMEAADFKDWTTVANAFIELIMNPYAVVSIAVYVFGLIVDTSTPGVKDSDVTNQKTDLAQTAEKIVTAAYSALATQTAQSVVTAAQTVATETAQTVAAETAQAVAAETVQPEAAQWTDSGTDESAAAAAETDETAKATDATE